MSHSPTGRVVGSNVLVGLLLDVGGLLGRKLLLLLRLDTGTRVTLFFTGGEVDFLVMEVGAGLGLLLEVGSLRGSDSNTRVRRVLTFPSGLLGVLVVRLRRLLGGLGFAVLVGRREDAEGDRNAGFKVQIGDFCWRERNGFSYNLSRRVATKGRQEGSSGSCSGTKVEDGGEKKMETGLTDSSFRG